MRFLLLSILLVLVSIASAQDERLGQLRCLRDTLKAAQEVKAQQLESLDNRLDSIRQQIEILSGWILDVNGVTGLDFSSSKSWVSNDNPNASTSALSIGLNAFANRTNERSFWRNSGIVNLGWQSLDTDTEDAEQKSFLRNRTTDVFQLSSLYGYRLNEPLALSVLSDLSTSAFNFLKPGSLDFGLGLTWTPARPKPLAVVFNPLTFHLIFSDRDDVTNTSALGLKIKSTYNRKFPLGINWGTTFTTFLPYRSAEPDQPSLLELTWINSLSFSVWKGLGFGINFGVRQADFEIEKLQYFHTVGLSFAF